MAKMKENNLHKISDDEIIWGLMQDRFDWTEIEFVNALNELLELNNSELRVQSVKELHPHLLRVLKRHSEFLSVAGQYLYYPFLVPETPKDASGKYSTLVYVYNEKADFIKKAAPHAQLSKAPFYVDAAVHKWLKSGKELPEGYKLISVTGEYTTNPQDNVAVTDREYAKIPKKKAKNGITEFDEMRIYDISSTIARTAIKLKKGEIK